MQLLQYSASLPCSGQWNSCNTVPRCLGAAGTAVHVMQGPSAWGQWAVQLLQCTASLPWSGGPWNSCDTPPHCPGALGCATPAIHCLTTWVSGQWNSYIALPGCPGAVGSATPAINCRTSWGQRAVQLLQRFSSLPGGSGQCNSCSAFPHCRGAAGSATPAMHCLTV